MSGTHDDSRLQEILREPHENFHEHCPPRFNNNFIDELKALKLHKDEPPLNLEQDPEKIAESSKFEFNIQPIATEVPGLRGIECSFEVNLNNQSGSTLPEEPDRVEVSRWSGVLTFRDAKNPHEDLEDPTMNQGLRTIGGIGFPPPELVENGDSSTEIRLSWTKTNLKALKVYDEDLGLEEEQAYIPCIDIRYMNVFYFRM